MIPSARAWKHCNLLRENFQMGGSVVLGAWPWRDSSWKSAADSNSRADSALGLAYTEIHFKSIHIKNKR